MKRNKLFVSLCVAFVFGSQGFTYAEEETPFKRAKDKLQTIVSANDEYVGGRTRADFEPYLESQSPSATIVMCSDSRVQPASLHDSPKGHLFTIRNIGNQIASNEGSVDYGVTILKTPLLLILGHTNCGAVNAVIKGYDNLDTSIKNELNTIDIAGAKNEKEALINNVNTQIDMALKKKEYKDLVDKKALFIVGGIYDMQNIFGHGHGALVFTNINGSYNPTEISKHPLFEGLEKAKIAK